MESARGDVDREGGAGSLVRADGDSEGNPFPEVLDLTTSLLLCLLCFLMFSTAGRRLSNKKSKHWGARPSSYSHFETPPFPLCITVTQHPRTQHFCSPLAELQARLLVPLWGGPSGAAPREPQGPCGDTVAKGRVGSSQPPLQCDWGQPLWGPWLKAGRCGDLGTCHGFSSFS